jgi:Ni,Fe-hydrogenase maturation factor
LTPELAENISHAQTVLFIDASRAGRPGEIRWMRGNPRRRWGTEADG